MRGVDNAGRRMCATRNGRTVPMKTSGAGGATEVLHRFAMLASVPGQLIGANRTLVGGRDGLSIAAADDGEWIARNRATANNRRDA